MTRERRRCPLCCRLEGKKHTLCCRMRKFQGTYVGGSAEVENAVTRNAEGFASFVEACDPKKIQERAADLLRRAEDKR